MRHPKSPGRQRTTLAWTCSKAMQEDSEEFHHSYGKANQKASILGFSTCFTKAISERYGLWFMDFMASLPAYGSLWIHYNPH
jgi:hypothetical protein